MLLVSVGKEMLLKIRGYLVTNMGALSSLSLEIVLSLTTPRAVRKPGVGIGGGVLLVNLCLNAIS